MSKKFCRNLKRSMWYGFHDILRDTAGLRPKSDRLRREEFWAVDDISFELKKGQTLGLIGPNGAGKTTLLKMLNGIIIPDKGNLRIKGRVGALIQLGAGFHPQLTGRENIYINGAILGMGKREIDKKFDAIVEFADIGNFLDTPVKHYSSGMFVRLGFAVAVHCEPDVLLIDEVLAVGDFQFRAKCFTHLSAMVENGTSVVLVSHNFEAIRRMCTECMFIADARVRYLGDAYEAVDRFKVFSGKRKWEQGGSAGSLEKSGHGYRAGTGEAVIKGLRFLDAQGVERDVFRTCDKIQIAIDYQAMEPIRNPIFAVAIEDPEGNLLHGIDTNESGFRTGTIEGAGRMILSYDRLDLLAGEYVVSAAIHRSNSVAPYDARFRQYAFFCKSGLKDRGKVYLSNKWQHLSAAQKGGVR
ncbi:MAG: ABC transporter ATP-binding protein [Phycisphaerae bacterium]